SPRRSDRAARVATSAGSIMRTPCSGTRSPSHLTPPTTSAKHTRKPFRHHTPPTAPTMKRPCWINAVAPLPAFASRIDRTDALVHGRPLWRMIIWLGLVANGLLISGAWWLAGAGFRQARTLDRVLACSVLSFTWCLLGLEGLGTAGLLAIGPLVVWMGLLCAAGLVVRWLRPVPAIGPVAEETNPEPWQWETLLALTFVLWVSVEMAMQSLLLPVKVVSDGPIYHLYFGVRWWKAGRLFLVATPFGENAATYFPANGDVWFTWLMVAWGGDRLARIGQVPFLLLAAIAVFRIGRMLG